LHAAADEEIGGIPPIETRLAMTLPDAMRGEQKSGK